MIKKESRNAMREARHEKIRQKVHGTEAIPRLNVFRSNANIYAQIIDDSKGVTLVSASSLELKLKNVNIEAATKVGESIAKKATKVGEKIAALAKKANIKKVVFDRGGYAYHGRVEALADAARENGLEF